MVIIGSHRVAAPILGLGCLLTLLVACYKPVLLDDGQFAYRDAAHYYYPLHLRVQQEWDAGRWPLWEPERNGGMPLLGNPTAAVLYPGKIIYALLPYAWGARLYVVAHTVLAFVGMVALARSWGISGTGAVLSGLSYAFGAPILFQYCNVIFLVGAAWAPLGFRAADRLLRLGERWGRLELAAVLALQALGGDPQSAYLTALCAAGYAVGLWWTRVPGRRRAKLLLGAVAAGWVAIALAAAQWFPSGRRGLLLVGGFGGLAVLWHGRRREEVRALGAMLAAWAGVGLLAMALAAVQLLPAWEFAVQSVRAADRSPLDLYAFSLEPYRVVELAWPNAFGAIAPENRSWLEVLPPVGGHEVWVPSLYLGGLVLVLALGAAGFAGGPPWRAWLTAVALVSLWASFGEFGGPLGWAREVPAAVAAPDPDHPAGGVPRADGSVRNGVGGLYWFLTKVLPGFDAFRFPSKLLTFTALALAALAGPGWDRVAAGRSRRVRGWAAGLLAITLAALAVSAIARGPILAAWSRETRAATAFGPLDPEGALADLQRALVHGGIVLALALAGMPSAARWPRRAGAAALLIATADLATANARLVWTVPQAEFQRTPEALRIIAAAERDHPAPGPFRVHRMPPWCPAAFPRRSSPRRLRELVAWERDTLRPQYGLPHGVSYTLTEGVLELHDYWLFFQPFESRVDSVAVSDLLGVAPGRTIVSYPRRGFDLWNTRYFILPVHPDGWDDANRGYASFLSHIEMIHPRLETLQGPAGRRRLERWAETEDWQVYRNTAAYPRAWIVHDARVLRPLDGRDARARAVPLREILFQDNPFRKDPDRPVYDPRAIAWIETDSPAKLARFLPRTRVEESEGVEVSRYEPQRVELIARLNRPGLVILADAFYPGWRLTIDGITAPILRANRMMRGAAVPAGTHRLVFTYEPMSVRVGAIISLAGLVAALALGLQLDRDVRNP